MGPQRWPPLLFVATQPAIVATNRLSDLQQIRALVRLAAEPDDLVYVDEYEMRGREQNVKLWTLAEAADRDIAVQQTFKSVSQSSG